MSTILKFPLERVQRRSYEIPKDSHNADVMLFEGVRYEKTDEPNKPLKNKKNTKRKANLKS